VSNFVGTRFSASNLLLSFVLIPMGLQRRIIKSEHS